MRAAAAAPASSTAVHEASEEAARPAEYAVISTPSGQQLVEEGKWFAISTQGAQQASSGSGGLLRFPAVAVKRSDGEFVRGRPFLADWVVEAELLDGAAWALGGGGAGAAVAAAPGSQEAEGAAGNGGGGRSLLGKVLVTRITHTEESRRRIQEALAA